MHDDDLSDDELRSALERRAGRSRPAGADGLLVRLDESAAERGRHGSGRGAWMAAAAVLTLLVGLTAAIASVDGPPTDDAVLGVDDDVNGDPADAASGIGVGPADAIPAEPCLPRGEPSSRDDCVVVDAGATTPLSETVGDLAQDPLGLDGASVEEVLSEYAEEFAEADLLVVNGTWGLYAHELFIELFAQSLEDPGSPWAAGHVGDALEGDWPGSVVFVSDRDPALRPAAVALAGSLGIIEGNVIDGTADPALWGMDVGFSPEVVILIGRDLDPEGAGCRETPEPGRCNVIEVPEPGEVPDILHPPIETRVLVLNATTATGAAGQTSDNLRLNRGYTTLTPGNSVVGGVAETGVYYVEGYELDARQIAQILNAPPASVQPLADGIVPRETDGDPHVIVVLGEDLIG